MTDPALVAALTALTQQVADDRQEAQRRTNQLVGALQQQTQQHQALVGLIQAQQGQQVQVVAPAAAQAAQPRISAAAVESIPQFEGALKDHPQDFVDFVERVAAAENWTDPQRIQVASRRLLRTALDWHIHTGHTHAAWADWSAAFVLNFSPRLHFGEWHRLVAERRQQPNESGIEYALDKYKLLRVSPIPLNDEQRVSFLIDGLAKWQHVAAMTANAPANVTAFIQRIRALETLGVTGRPDAQPPGPVAQQTVPDFGAALTALGDRLVEQMMSRLSIGNRGGGRGGSSRGRGWVDPGARSCYNCGVVGHMSRNCPSKHPKGPAGP